MPYEIGISSGIMGAASPEEAHLYVGLARKALYATTQGVNFTQIDLESISELEVEGLKEEMEKVRRLGISFGIHSETRAFGVEAAELDSAIETAYKRAHERMEKILKLSKEIGSKYVLIHSSESEPLRHLEMVLQPSLLVDFFGNPFNEFLAAFPFLKEWLIGGKIEDVAAIIIEVFNEMGENKDKITAENIRKGFAKKSIRIPDFLWRELLPRGMSFFDYFAEFIKSVIEAELRRLGREVLSYSEICEKFPDIAKAIDEVVEDRVRREVEDVIKYFIDFSRSRSLHYGPERFAYIIVAKYLEKFEPKWWNEFVDISAEYLAKSEDPKLTKEEWFKKKGIKEKSIDDEKFREIEALWVPAVSSKFIWGHFWQEKNWKIERGEIKEPLFPDFKKYLRGMPLIFESPMAHRGVEELLRLANPLQLYYLCKEIGENITGIAMDFEHMMSLRLKPELVIDLLPEDGGKMVKVIHAGWPSPLAPTHLPLLLGSEEQLKYYKWLFKLRKKGFGVKEKAVILYERGAAHIRESIITLKKIAEFLEKEIPVEELPLEFFGIAPKEVFAEERQLATIKEHAFDPLRDLLVLPEEIHGLFGRAAIEKGIPPEKWKKEELR